LNGFPATCPPWPTPNAAKLKPANHYLRASILQEEGRIQEAAASVKQTLFLDPGFVLGHFTLGNLARTQGKTDESHRHFANAVRLLDQYPEEAILPESEGVTAGRLARLIASITEREV
jgi:chemotaxis protein methyltransferase CheR